MTKLSGTEYRPPQTSPSSNIGRQHRWWRSRRLCWAASVTADTSPGSLSIQQSQPPVREAEVVGRRSRPRDLTELPEFPRFLNGIRREPRRLGQVEEPIRHVTAFWTPVRDPYNA
ncbi:hypothetical protein Trydic_g19631 [Trypoxylus dichotomus]